MIEEEKKKHATIIDGIFLGTFLHAYNIAVLYFIFKGFVWLLHMMFDN